MALELKLHSPAGAEAAVYKWPLQASVRRVSICPFLITKNAYFFSRFLCTFYFNILYLLQEGKEGANEIIDTIR